MIFIPHCSLKNITEALKMLGAGQQVASQPAIYNGSLLAQVLHNDLNASVQMALFVTLRTAGKQL